MSNRNRLLFRPSLRSFRWGLLATACAISYANSSNQAIGEQPSKNSSSRKSNVPNASSHSTRSKQPVRAAVATKDESTESISLAGCKNCQSNNNSVSTHEYSSPVAMETHDAVVEEGSFAGTASDCDACDSDPIFVGGCCGNACGLDPCSPLALLSQRLYMRAEVASFWGSGQNLPTLVTTSVGNPLPAIDDAGLLGAADTRSLFGGSEVNRDGSAGIRYEVGLWLDDCKSRAAVVRLFHSGDNEVNLQTDGTRQAVIARNFLDVGPPREQSLVSIAYPNQTSGSISANLTSYTNGGDLLLRQVLVQDHLVRCDWLMGYQTARISETLDIVSDTTDLTAAQNPRLDQEDHFRVRNQFHGATFGFSGEAREGNWYFGSLFKVGFGNMERRTDISGFSRTTVGTDTSTQNQGLLARQTNIGTYRQETFVITPELGLHVGYRLTHQLDLTLGYSMLRLPKIARVTDALDRELASNVSDPLVGEVRPTFSPRESNFTLHSLNLGLQWAY